MKKFLVAMGLAAFALVGCGDESSSFSGPNNDDSVVKSSSSVERTSSSSGDKVSDKVDELAESVELAEETSSSSKKAKSSSSKEDEDAKESSSSVKSKSSSVESPQSGSGGKTGASSSSSNYEDSDELSSSEMVTIESSDGSIYDNSSNTLTDLRNGLVYKTVTIGLGSSAQTWMAENLNYAYLGRTSSLDSSSFCYDDIASNCETYGRLYLWSAAMDSAGTFSSNGKGCGVGTACSASGLIRGMCPKGWHLPSNAEWNALFTAVGGKSTAGEVLKSQAGWCHSGNGSDAYAFSALPAGQRKTDGFFHSATVNISDCASEDRTYFWSSSEYDRDLDVYGSFAYSVRLSFNYSSAALSENYKSFGASVRCLKD